jgi:secreted trypsin-like serine protease
MNKVVANAVALLLISTLFLICSAETTQTKVQYGKPAKRGERPYTVALVDKRNPEKFMECGGVLIGATWVLTAAHCIDEEDDDKIVAGSLVIKGRTEGQVVDSKRVITHPNYNKRTLENDIGLIELVAPIRENGNTIKYASLFSGRDLPVGTKLQVSGWGEREDQKISNFLVTAEVDVRPLEDCRMRLPRDADKMCAGGAAPNYTDACGGDSGGPLVLQQGNQNYVVGIVSFGPSSKCGTRGTYGAYSKVSHNLQWIQRTSGISPPSNFHISISKK